VAKSLHGRLQSRDIAVTGGRASNSTQGSWGPATGVRRWRDSILGSVESKATRTAATTRPLFDLLTQGGLALPRLPLSLPPRPPPVPPQGPSLALCARGSEPVGRPPPPHALAALRAPSSPLLLLSTGCHTHWPGGDVDVNATRNLLACALLTGGIRGGGGGGCKKDMSLRSNGVVVTKQLTTLTTCQV
jgi:hypothetical protein